MPHNKFSRKFVIIIVLILFIIFSATGVVIYKYVNNTSRKSSNDTRANAGLTNSVIDQKYGEIANMLDSIAVPLFNRDIKPTFDSIESQNSNLSIEAIADKKAQTLCSAKPVGLTDLELWAQWRGCVGAGHIILANHYTRLFAKSHNELDQVKAAASIYMMSTYLETFITGPEYSLLASISLTDPISTYKLRDTFHSFRYLSDSNGFFSAYGFSYANGTMPAKYCTPLETPFDSGRNCRTIDLQQRVKIISSGIAAKIASEWMIHSDGTLRTEFWNNDEYWRVSNSTPYMISPNNVYDPTHGIGWYDLLGRRTMSKNLQAMSMDPYFLTWTMAGMADVAKLASAEGGAFKFMYDFGIKSAGYGIDFDPNNINGDFATLNDYGQPLKGVSSYCDGITNLFSKDLLTICEGGTREVYQAGRGKNAPVDFLGLTYNTGQHLGTNMAELNWGHCLTHIARMH